MTENNNATVNGEIEHRTGNWLGQLEGLKVREQGPDADGPIVEFHGEDGMAATEITSERFVNKLSEMAAEVQMVLDGVNDTE